MNKKGTIMGETMVDLVCTIALIFIIVLGIWAFQVAGKFYSGKDENLESMVGERANLMLLNYLKTPYSDGTIGNALMDLVDGKGDEKALKEETEKLLSELRLHGMEGWNLEIKKMPEDKMLMEIKTFEVIGWYGRGESFVDMPLKENGKYLRLKLYLETQDA